jgi:hypothetical protein
MKAAAKKYSLNVSEESAAMANGAKCGGINGISASVSHQ